MSDPLTVVLPCAGSGSRLGAPIPKELVSIPNGRMLIDSSLDVIRQLPEDTRVLLIAASDRAPTVRYVQSVLEERPVAVLPARASTTQRGLASTLEYVAPWLTSRNLLMFPDQVFARPRQGNLEELIKSVGRSPIGFLHQNVDPRHDADRIMADGALELNGQLIRRVAEKPRNPSGFNALWVAVAFRRDLVPALVQFFDGEPRAVQLVARGCTSWPVDGYVNVNSPTDLASIWGRAT